MHVLAHWLGFCLGWLTVVACCARIWAMANLFPSQGAGSKFSFDTAANRRPAFQKRLATHVAIRCQKCGMEGVYHSFDYPWVVANKGCWLLRFCIDRNMGGPTCDGKLVTHGCITSVELNSPMVPTTLPFWNSWYL